MGESFRVASSLPLPTELRSVDSDAGDLDGTDDVGNLIERQDERGLVIIDRDDCAHGKQAVTQGRPHFVGEADDEAAQLYAVNIP